jgi:hypothetical protein
MLVRENAMLAAVLLAMAFRKAFAFLASVPFAAVMKTVKTPSPMRIYK